MSNSGWEWVDLPLANQGGVWRKIRPQGTQSTYQAPETITKLTSAQETLLAKLRRKWRNDTLSNQPIDRPYISEMIRSVYMAITHSQYVNDRLERPEILFFDTPEAACQEVLVQWITQTQIDQHKLEHRILVQPKLWEGVLLGGNIPMLDPSLKLQYCKQPPSFTWKQVWEKMEQRLYEGYLANYWSKSFYFGEDKVRGAMRRDLLLPDSWADQCSWLELCIKTFNYRHNSDAWEALQALVRDCGWFFPFDKVCIVCDRTWL